MVNYVEKITSKRFNIIILVVICLLITTTTIYASTMNGFYFVGNSTLQYYVGSSNIQYLVGDYDSGSSSSNIAIVIFSSLASLILALFIIIFLLTKISTLKMGVNSILVLASTAIFMIIMYIVIYNLLLVIRS